MQEISQIKSISKINSGENHTALVDYTGKAFMGPGGNSVYNHEVYEVYGETIVVEAIQSLATDPLHTSTKCVGTGTGSVSGKFIAFFFTCYYAAQNPGA